MNIDFLFLIIQKKFLLKFCLFIYYYISYSINFLLQYVLDFRFYWSIHTHSGMQMHLYNKSVKKKKKNK